jgi:hypothetical protein
MAHQCPCITPSASVYPIRSFASRDGCDTDIQNGPNRLPTVASRYGTALHTTGVGGTAREVVSGVYHGGIAGLCACFVFKLIKMKSTYDVSEVTRISRALSRYLATSESALEHVEKAIKLHQISCTETLQYLPQRRLLPSVRPLQVSSSIMKCLGISRSVFQDTFTGRPTSYRAVANGPNGLSTARSFSPIDVSGVLAYTTISSSKWKTSKVDWLLSLLNEGVVAFGSTSSCGGGGMTGDCKSISATCKQLAFLCRGAIGAPSSSNCGSLQTFAPSYEIL